VKLDVTGSGIRDSYIESKLNEYLSVPLNQKNLEEGLSLLRADPLIGDIISSINWRGSNLGNTLRKKFPSIGSFVLRNGTKGEN
jgi:hypothetical protein